MTAKIAIKKVWAKPAYILEAYGLTRYTLKLAREQGLVRARKLSTDKRGTWVYNIPDVEKYLEGDW